MNTVLHNTLKERLIEIIQDISSNMVRRFAISLPYNEVQRMLMSEDTVTSLQVAGRIMSRQALHYEYKLGKTVIIELACYGGNEMPWILFPTDELIVFSQEFLDLIRPLYLITKAWIDVQLAFNAVLKIIQDTRELNFYVPWLRHIIPNDDFTNKYNSSYRVANWLHLHSNKHGVIDLITRQVQCIINDDYTSKRTWMPSELVRMVRQGEELVTQYNIMKTIAMPETLMRDCVNIRININTTEHPTIKWTADAVAQRTMNEAMRIKELDERKLNER